MDYIENILVKNQNNEILNYTKNEFMEKFGIKQVFVDGDDFNNNDIKHKNKQAKAVIDIVDIINNHKEIIAKYPKLAEMLEFEEYYEFFEEIIKENIEELSNVFEQNYILKGLITNGYLECENDGDDSATYNACEFFKIHDRIFSGETTTIGDYYSYATRELISYIQKHNDIKIFINFKAY